MLQQKFQKVWSRETGELLKILTQKHFKIDKYIYSQHVPKSFQSGDGNGEYARVFLQALSYAFDEGKLYSFSSIVSLFCISQCRMLQKIWPFLPRFSRRNWRVIFEVFSV